MNTIKSISFPNTVGDNDKAHYNCPEYFFEIIEKNGELAQIRWIQIWKGKNEEGCYKKLIAEIKESVCDIYFI